MVYKLAFIFLVDNIQLNNLLLRNMLVVGTSPTINLRRSCKNFRNCSGRQNTRKHQSWLQNLLRVFWELPRLLPNPAFWMSSRFTNSKQTQLVLLNCLAAAVDGKLEGKSIAQDADLEKKPSKIKIIVF